MPKNASPVATILNALAAAGPTGDVPDTVPVFAADWTELAADSVPVDRGQIAMGAEYGDILAATLAAEMRAGRITWGRVCDRRTGLVLAEYPAPDLGDVEAARAALGSA